MNIRNLYILPREKHCYDWYISDNKCYILILMYDCRFQYTEMQGKGKVPGNLKLDEYNLSFKIG